MPIVGILLALCTVAIAAVLAWLTITLAVPLIKAGAWLGAALVLFIVSCVWSVVRGS